MPSTIRPSRTMQVGRQTIDSGSRSLHDREVRDAAAEPRVEDVAQPVAEEVEAEDGDHDRGARDRSRPRRSRRCRTCAVASMLPHAASGGCVPRPRKLRVASARIADREVDGRQHDQRRDDVRDHVAEHDPQIVRAEAASRLDEGEAHHLEHRRADDARERGGDDDADRDHRVRPRRPEQARDQDREHEAREREHDVHDAHQRQVDPAAVEAGQQADQGAEDERDRDRDDADLKRDLGAVDDPCERVAADLVRAHRVRPARAEQPVGGRVVRVDRPDEAAEERGQDDAADDDGAGDADRVAPAGRQREPPPLREGLPDAFRGAHPTLILGSR